MRKYRAAYLAVLVCIGVLTFQSGSGFLLTVGAVWACLPVLLWLMLRLDAQRISLECRTGTSCWAGQELNLTILAGHRGPLTAAGTVKVTLCIRNVLFGQETVKEYLLPLSGGSGCFEQPVTPKLCGGLIFECRKAVCYDLMGVCYVSLKNPKMCMATVYPSKVPLVLIQGRSVRGRLEGERQYRNCRGGDISEVFDLREYMPGDDVRSIHWKLSGKLDTLILREGSDPSRDSTMLLCDAGLFLEGQPADARLLSAAMETAVQLSGCLAELGIAHNVGIPAGDGPHCMEVHRQSDHLHMTEEWMGIHLQEQSGNGLKLYLEEHLDRFYSRLIYVTAEEAPKYLRSLPDWTEIIVFCIVDREGEVRLAQERNCQLIELPADTLYTKTYQIMI